MDNKERHVFKSRILLSNNAKVTIQKTNKRNFFSQFYPYELVIEDQGIDGSNLTLSYVLSKEEIKKLKDILIALEL